jgi:hypothetical protein
MDIPRVALMSKPTQKLAAGISDIPIIGAPLQRAADNAVSQAEGRVGDLARSVGTPGRETAGAGIQEGIRSFRTKTLGEIEQEAYRPINEAISPEMRFVPAASIEAISKLRSRLAESSGKLTGEAARVQRALEENKGHLTFQAIQDLRSGLGEAIRAPVKSEGFNEGAAKHLYAKLSEDLKEAARTAGGDTLAAAWDSANKTTREAWKQFKSVRDLAGETTSPNSAFEQAFALAMDKRGDVGKLAKLRSTVPPDAWENLKATAIDRLGKNNSDNFSMPFFVSNYDKMSPSARNVLFGEEVNRSVGDMAASLKALQGIERYKSKSQSANPLVIAGAASGIGAAAVANPLSAVATAMTAIAGYSGASFLARPASAKSMASWTKAYTAYVKNPTVSAARSLNNRAKIVAGTIAAEAGAPEAAAAIMSELQGLTRANDNTITVQPSSYQK